MTVLDDKEDDKDDDVFAQLSRSKTVISPASKRSDGLAAPVFEALLKSSALECSRTVKHGGKFYFIATTS